jgi:phage N-6-adenine-methyltransferase
MFRAFKPTNHPNMVKKRGVDDAVDDRETPLCVYVPLDAEFAFTLDPAASHENRKCLRYCTLEGKFMRLSDGSYAKLHEGNGLTVDWGPERVFLNPPFSRLRPWVEKAWDETEATVVMLLPNNRGEQPFFQDLIEPYRDRPGSILTTRNLRKRRPFLCSGQEIGNRTSKSPPFGLTLVLWDRRRPTLGAR